MKEKLASCLYDSIVEENTTLYKELFENTKVRNATNTYFNQAIELYEDLETEKQDVLLKIIKQTIIDTVSNVLGIIDGSSTLIGFDAEMKLLINEIETEGELQDVFLEYVDTKRNE